MFLLPLLALLALAPGCASKQYFRSEAFDPRVPYRVAILPFVDRSAGDSIVSVPLAAAIDLTPILSDDDLTKASSPTVMRLAFHQNLSRSSLEVIDLFIVDSLLHHHGLEPTAALYEGDLEASARRAASFVGADLVVFGEVTRWDRAWYLVESTAEAGLKVEIREAVSGGVVYRAEVTDSEVSGISKLPIAYSPQGAVQSIVGESLKGLRNTIFAELSADVARAIVDGLLPRLEERAAGKVPFIHFVAHSGDAPLRPGDVLRVVALGDAGAHAVFSIGDGHGVAYPMRETAPGRYVGALVVSKAHRFDGEMLTVRLTSKELLSSTMTIARPPVRTEGPSE